MTAPIKGTKPKIPVKPPKAMAHGIKGKTSGLTTKEISETEPDILMISGKTKIWTAAVEATISLTPNLVGINF